MVHVDESDPDKHESVLRNVANLLDAEDNISVEIVAHGPGLAAVLKDSPHADRLRELLDRGVQVAACANTMKSRDISDDQLVVGSRVVPAGIAELVTKQRDGWAYVRP
jgi:intracellular sulfur oxidation DsrE/DsrF family protein